MYGMAQSMANTDFAWALHRHLHRHNYAHFLPPPVPLTALLHCCIAPCRVSTFLLNSTPALVIQKFLLWHALHILVNYDCRYHLPRHSDLKSEQSADSIGQSATGLQTICSDRKCGITITEVDHCWCYCKLANTRKLKFNFISIQLECSDRSIVSHVISLYIVNSYLGWDLISF